MRKYLTGLFFAALVIFLFAAGNVMAQGIDKVDINLGDSASLQELPGIGPAMALRIIEYRETKGSFQRIEDLMEVKGIGEKRFLNLQDLIVVSSIAEKNGEEPEDKVE
jgi:competence ComEA-like helix-hairpin-helix protein